IGQVEVARHDGLARQAELAIDDRGVEARIRSTDAAALAKEVVITEGVYDSHFGGAVADGGFRARQSLLDIAQKFLRYERGAGDGIPQARQVVRRHPIEHAAPEGGYAVEG